MARGHCLRRRLAMEFTVTKNEYIASQLALGKTHSQIIAEQPMVDVVGSIRGDNLRNVVAILAGGLQFRLDTAPESPIRTALLTAFKYMMLPDYAINLSLPENAGLLENAVQVGLVSSDERAMFFALATYQRPLFESLTIYDIVAVESPAKVLLGDWQVLTDVNTTRLMLTLHSDMPEPTLVRIEMRESHNGVDWTTWRRVSHFYDVQSAGVYYQQIPFNGLLREVRVRGEQYAFDGAVAVV